MKNDRDPLAASIRGALTPVDAPDEVELERRTKVKDALYRAIELVDLGLFASAIITEVKADKWPREYVTQMYGERDIIQSSAAQIVMHYSKKHRQAKQAAITVDAAELLEG